MAATVLVVDDTKSIRQLVKAELEEEGYRVLLARNGQEALGVLLDDPPDLVVLDLRMPTMDGLETIARIRATKPVIPVIFYTARHKDYLDDLRAWSPVACVEKSGDLTELKRAIFHALECRRRRTGSPDAPSARREHWRVGMKR